MVMLNEYFSCDVNVFNGRIGFIHLCTEDDTMSWFDIAFNMFPLIFVIMILIFSITVCYEIKTNWGHDL